MTLSALFEQIDVPLDRRRAAAQRRSISAVPCRSTAASCCTGRSATGNRRSRSTTTSGSRRRRTCSRRSRAARARRTCSCRWATPAGRPASSRRRSRRTPGSPSAADPEVLFDTPVEPRACRGDAAARHRFLAPVRRRRARVTREPTARSTRPRCSRSISARAGSASPWAIPTGAHRASADDDRRRGERGALRRDRRR